MATLNRQRSRQAFLLLLAAMLACFAVMMRPFWVPAGLAAVAVIVCAPLYQWLLLRCRGHRYCAAFFALLLVGTFVLLPLGAVIATVIAEIVRFAHVMVNQLQGGQLAMQVDQINQWITQAAGRFGDVVPEGFNLRSVLVAGASTVAKTLYQFSPKVLASTAQVGVTIVLWLLFVFVLFAEGQRLYRYFMDLSPLSASHELVIAKEVREMVSASLLATIATCAANGVLMGLMFWMAPLDRPVVWGLVTFGLSFIPVIGAFSVWLGGAIYLLLVGEIGWAVALTLFGCIIIAQTDNVIKPLVMRGRVNIHPVLLLMSLLGGVTFMGPSGLIFGPVFIAVLLACLRIYRREFAA